MLEVTKFVNSRFASNTYIMSHPEHENVWVVDPGDTEPVFEWMKNHQKTSVTGILLTHAHFDHIYGVNTILNSYPDCVVYTANEYGVEVLHDPKKNGSRYTEEGAIVIIETANVSFLKKRILLWEGVELQSINTPGHSDDSLCFFAGKKLFTGDTLIKDVRTVTKLKGGSVMKLEESMKVIAALKGSNLQVLPGHGDEFELDEYDLSKMNNNPLNKSRICQQ